MGQGSLDGLEVGGAKHGRREDLDDARARVVRGHDFARRHRAGHGDEAVLHGGFNDIQVDVRRDGVLRPRVARHDDLLLREYRAGPDEKIVTEMAHKGFDCLDGPFEAVGARLVEGHLHEAYSALGVGVGQLQARFRVESADYGDDFAVANRFHDF